MLGDIGQIIVLGGKEPDGTYFHNELTEFFMSAQAELKHPDPKVLLRVSKDMPPQLVKKAVDCLIAGTGSPIFSNDDIIIEKLEDYYIESEDK